MTSDQPVSRRAFLHTATGAAVAVGASGAASAQEETATENDGEGGGGGGQTHTVDMTDQLVFDPEDITIAPGDTVVWENVGSVGHSVTAYEEQIPDGATYFASGGFDSEQAARDGYPAEGNIPGGEAYEHTFQTTGTYEYFCIPHETVGMVGTVTVQEGGAGGGEGGGGRPAIPDGAKTLGVAAFTSMMGILGLAYVFLRYGSAGADIPE